MSKKLSQKSEIWAILAHLIEFNRIWFMKHYIELFSVKCLLLWSTYKNKNQSSKVVHYLSGKF